MRSVPLLALILAGLTFTASAQQPYKTPKAKPHHSEENRSSQKQGKVGVSDKKLTPHTSNAQELRHVEQQTAKAASKRSAKHLHPARLKGEHEKENRPIHIASSATGVHGSLNNQGKNPYRGRVKQKGSGKH
jgi:hypothetical protein